MVEDQSREIRQLGSWGAVEGLKLVIFMVEEQLEEPLSSQFAVGLSKKVELGAPVRPFF